jgi:hypothetical protein
MSVSNKTQYFRVIVIEGFVGGQLVRASYNGREWFVRVPTAAVVGDSFTFPLMSDEDEAAAAAAALAGTRYIIESAVLEVNPEKAALKKSSSTITIRGLFQDLIEDPYRIVVVGVTFVIAFVNGMVWGAIYYIREVDG